MSFSRPSLKELWERAITDISSQLRIGSPLKRSIVSAIAYAVAGIAHLLYGFLDWIYKQIFPDSCDEENLLRHAQGAGVDRKPGSFAQIEVKFKGVNGSVVEEGTYLNRADGIQFITQSDVTILGGEGSCLALALIHGSKSNTSAGTILNLQTIFSGVNGQVEVLPTNSISGQDEESLESLLERLLDKKRQPPHGGNENDYKQWAREVPGVTRAFVYPKRMGLGTVGVSFLMDNEVDIIPSPAKVEEVQAYIEALRPVTSELWVFAPESQAINFIINISPMTAAARLEIENEIRDLFKREAEPDRIMPISKINEAISIANGEEDHILVEPGANIVPDLGKILIPGTFTFYEL